jgi:hypothetical protein
VARIRKMLHDFVVIHGRVSLTDFPQNATAKGCAVAVHMGLMADLSYLVD